MSVHFSSKTDEWETPQDLFDKLDAIHNFDLDCCATMENRKVKAFISKETDALRISWNCHKVIWMNPPYGKEIGKWMKKAYEESLKGCKVVCLIPARTDTAWWHDYAMRGEIELLRGRLKFGGHKNSAPFPSAIVVFNESQKVGK
jgi:phage N-6-adenine-methyltransferase